MCISWCRFLAVDFRFICKNFCFISPCLMDNVPEGRTINKIFTSFSTIKPRFKYSDYDPHCLYWIYMCFLSDSVHQNNLYKFLKCVRSVNAACSASPRPAWEIKLISFTFRHEILTISVVTDRVYMEAHFHVTRRRRNNFIIFLNIF